MQNLLDQLTYASSPYARLGVRQRGRLVENLRIDVPALRYVGWLYRSDMPKNRGGNATLAMLEEAKRRLNAHTSFRTGGGSFSTVLNEAVQALNPLDAAGNPDHFCRIAPSSTCLTNHLWNVTTLSALQHSFTARGAWQKALYDWLNAPNPAACAVQPNLGRISLGRKGSLLWMSDKSPLQFLASRGLSAGTRDAAMAVLRELALPGFETKTRREEAMALVCVGFAAQHLVDQGRVAQVWKPTAIDALNYKGYFFLPGRIADSHGLTWPLRKNLRAHENRDGLREFVHPRIEVPAFEGGQRTVHLIGFLDPGAEAIWNSYA